jgi:hypothetical protein
LVELEVVDSIGTETVRQTLKKTPPQQNLWVRFGSGR